MQYFAHSENDDGRGRREPLREHLERVSKRSAEFARMFGAEAQARAAGLLHDLAKYSEQFLRRIDPALREASRDHWTAGAYYCLRVFGDFGIVPALVIMGHHIGLTQIESYEGLEESWRDRLRDHADELTTNDLKALLSHFASDNLACPSVEAGLTMTEEHAAANMLDVRMLFSALVDADFIETEAHFNGDATVHYRERPDGPALDAALSLDAVHAEIAKKAIVKVDDGIRVVRDRVLHDCLAAAELPKGVFNLSAPTGSGKTLAMLAFALAHAKKHGLRRIVVVMPYLNIVDQTAAIYRDLFSSVNGFPADYMLEDHSNVRPPDETDDDSVKEATRLSRLLAENWDAPIILTTTVQCLESLHANRPSACRKLHRLANSLILFDEVQTLPVELAVPTLATLSRLQERFGASVVFATATQPAFDHFDQEVKAQAAGGWNPHEIIRDTDEIFASTKARVRVDWRLDRPTPWHELADELSGNECRQVLCIVNLKRHAQRLAQDLQARGVEGVLHLSTTMCPLHRLAVLAQVKDCLKRDLPLRLISTQCVECGIDLDVRVVFRALGPLEAIVQAAGRCNRHGLLADGGRFVVFVPEAEGQALYPGGSYESAAKSTENYLRGLAIADGSLDDLEILNDPQRMRTYYKRYYHLHRRHAESAKACKAHDSLAVWSFEKMAAAYRLIEDDNINVLVPYDPPAFEKLKREIESEDARKPQFIRDWIQRARPYTISVPRRALSKKAGGYFYPIFFSRKSEDCNQSDWFFMLGKEFYDSELLGFRDGEQEWIA